METQPSVEPLHVVINREMFSTFYLLTTPADGFSEELELEEVREWFKQRGANMDVIEDALTMAWNFLRAEVLIEKPRLPKAPVLPYSPNI
jgi:hypothetical protein